MIILVLFLLLLLLTALYVIYNLNRKYSHLEEVSQDNVEFILAIRSRVLSQQSYLKQLDRRGSFESDDEVGVVFKEIKKIINDIALYLEFEKDVDNDDENNVRGTIERF
jgi:hypothetical protein